MSYWVVQSFAVENPEERLEEVRHHLTLADDFIGVVDTAPEKAEYEADADAQREVLAMTCSRLVQPDMRSAYAIKPDDETLFGPFMDLVLEPGEYGCVLGVNDTSDSGYGHVYYKRKSDGEVEILDEVSGHEGGVGEYAAKECEAKYGFRPHTRGESSLDYRAKERDDPFVKYRGMSQLEPVLADDEPVLETDGLSCPECGATDEVEDHRYSPRNVYEEKHHCEACDEYFRTYHLHLLPAPGEDCPECGGAFAERDLQYPSLGSTAYECADCGFITFDALELDDEELDPDAKREDAIGPDVEAYREKHDVDPEEWEE